MRSLHGRVTLPLAAVMAAATLLTACGGGSDIWFFRGSCPATPSLVDEGMPRTGDNPWLGD